MKVGDVTELLRTPRGYQILKLESSTADADAAVRAGARADQRARVHRQAARRVRRSTSSRLRAQAIIEWKNDELKKAYDEGLKQQAERRRSRAPSTETDGMLRRRSGSRSGRGRATSRSSASSSSRSRSRRSCRRSPLEPLEGSQEEDRLAAVSRLLLRALRSRRRAAGPEVHRRRQHRLVRGRAGADSRVRDRQHPACWSRATCSTIPCPLIREGHDGRGRPRPAQGRRRPAGAQGRARARLVLSVDLIGQAVSVEVDAADVKPY